MKAFLATIYAAKDVFLLYFSVLVIASGMGHILFRRTVRAEEINNSWSTFFKSMITAFIFVSTGDNYTDCVYGSAEASAPNGKVLCAEKLC